jgi:RNA polymerase sigma-70 factor, ECF subfamily
VSGLRERATRAESAGAVEAALAGDETAFGTLVETYRAELRVHCYRMVGSLDESEDLVQETFLRAWRRRETFAGRSTFRAWLYRIATNACLDALERRPPRLLPPQMVPVTPAEAPMPPLVELACVEPYPDRLLPDPDDPAAAVVAKETLELAFIVAIQFLPARQRAVLILRDVLGYPAKEAADLLEMSVPALKSALQRARLTLKEHLPGRRGDWAAPSIEPSAAERKLLRRYIAAIENADPDAFTALLCADVRQSMPPYPLWFQGREVFVEGWRPMMVGPDAWGEWRVLETAANRQPALAAYLRRPGESAFSGSWLGVFAFRDGLISEITTYEPTFFAAFGLPEQL